MREFGVNIQCARPDATDGVLTVPSEGSRHPSRLVYTLEGPLLLSDVGVGFGVAAFGPVKLGAGR